MKIIFLDIDGVVNNQDITRFHQGRAGEYAYGVFTGEDYFDPHCVENLNEIIRTTGAKLVISSSWRLLFDMETLSDFFVKQKIEGEIIDYTNRYKGERGHEIQEWLTRHPEVESFVILDDDSDMAHLLPYHVKTSWKKGLEKKHIKLAVDMLNKS